MLTANIVAMVIWALLANIVVLSGYFREIKGVFRDEPFKIDLFYALLGYETVIILIAVVILRVGTFGKC